MERRRQKNKKVEQRKNKRHKWNGGDVKIVNIKGQMESNPKPVPARIVRQEELGVSNVIGSRVMRLI